MIDVASTDRPMRYKIAHTTLYTYSEPVPVCYSEVHLTPRDHALQACVYNRLLIKPSPTGIEKRLDYFGNHVSFFTLQEGHNRFSVTALSKVQVTAPTVPDPASTQAWEDVRAGLNNDRSLCGLDAYQYTFDSQHVVANSELAAYAAPSFTPRRPILEASLDLTSRIFHDFKYDPSATTVNTPLAEVLRNRRGVCQDFAHLQIGCLRSLGLAARYVSGYLLTMPPPGQPRLVGSDASHAWLSVYLQNFGWIDLDPTNNKIPKSEHITLAWGRDYGDVCPIKGVFVGGGNNLMSVTVDVLPLDGGA